jgi:hypothetical protein
MGGGNKHGGSLFAKIFADVTKRCSGIETNRFAWKDAVSKEQQKK